MAFTSTDDASELEKLDAQIEEQLRAHPQSYPLRLAAAQLCAFLDRDHLAAASHFEHASRVEGITSQAKAIAFFGLGENLIKAGDHSRAANALREAIRRTLQSGDRTAYPLQSVKN
jgi:hypothetical protein